MLRMQGWWVCLCVHTHTHTHMHTWRREAHCTGLRARGPSLRMDSRQESISYSRKHCGKGLLLPPSKQSQVQLRKGKSCHRSSPVATSMACYRKQAGFLPIYQHSGSVQSRQSHAHCPANTQGSRLGSPWELTAASGGFRTMRRRGRGCV